MIILEQVKLYLDAALQDACKRHLDFVNAKIMNEIKVYETNRELYNNAIAGIIETLANYDGYYCDLHNEVFNTDDFTVYNDVAEGILESLGVFSVIREVMEYENNMFGEVFTELHTPVKLLNMYYYIKGEEVMNAIDFWDDETWNGLADDTTNRKAIDWIRTNRKNIIDELINLI